MNESHSFKSAREGLKEVKKDREAKPFKPKEAEDESVRPMTTEDHWRSLTYSIFEKTGNAHSPEEEIDATAVKDALKEIMTPALLKEYKQILLALNEKTKPTRETRRRQYIDIEEESIAASIENWIANLLNAVKEKKSDINPAETEELEMQSWFLFESIVNVMNTGSMDKDIHDFWVDSKADDQEITEIKMGSLLLDLESEYKLSKVEAQIIFDLAMSYRLKDENYSPKVLIETISKVWKEYKLNEKTGTIAKISLGYLMSKGLESFAPSLYENIIVDDKFKVAVFLEYFGLSKLSEGIEAVTNIETEKLVKEIRLLINKRITESIFFQEFEYIHDKSLGEIFNVLENGEASTELLIEETISKFAPMLTGIGMSIVFLTKINPILGGIGLASLPVMYRVAKKQNERAWPMYEKEKSEGEQISKRLSSIKSGFDEVKTSPATPDVAYQIREQMNTRDTLRAERFIEVIKMNMLSKIPLVVSTVVSAIIGGVLQRLGIISGGAVLSNIIYSKLMSEPIEQLVDLYFDDFFRYVQDIKRMDEILGSYEQIDLPEGEKEKERIPVSELKNFNISIKNLKFKNIFQGVNLEIKQGDFLVITGPSGIGKSTLLRTIVGLYKPDAGKIKIGGVNNDKIKKYGKESLYATISYCNQSPKIFEGMTLKENLLLWSQMEVDDERIKKIMRDLRLDKFVDRLDEEVKNLSGGEKVRIGLARTLIKGAKIMLLDEPTASIDSFAAKEIRKLIAEINEMYPDTTIICVSHDEELVSLGKQVFEMHEAQEPEEE